MQTGLLLFSSTHLKLEFDVLDVDFSSSLGGFLVFNGALDARLVGLTSSRR